jgi:hypothetical protein
VLLGSGNYGDPSNPFVPSLDPQPPSEDDVRLGVVYFGGSLTGNCRVPAVAQVQFGLAFDSNDSLVGSFAGKVISSTICTGK